MHTNLHVSALYLAIFGQLTSQFLEKVQHKIGHNKHTYVTVSVVQYCTGFGENAMHKSNIMLGKQH